MAKLAPAVRPGVSWRPRAVFKRLWTNNSLVGFGTLALVLLLWEGVYLTRWINPVFTSAPSRVGAELVKLFVEGSIWRHLYASGVEFGVGFGVSAVIGVVLGILMGWYGRLNAMLDPLVVALYATPRVALLPLIIIWLGIGMSSKIALVILSAVFPILVNTATGVRTLDAHQLEAAHSFGASDWQIFTTVALPGATPSIITGLRLGVARGLIGVFVAEMYAATAGIGFMIAQAGNSFLTDKVFAGVVIFAITGIVFNALLSKIEARFDAWRPQRGGTTTTI